MRLDGARLNSTSMLGLVVQSIRPSRVRHRHGAVIVEPIPVQHPEHGVSAHGQEGGPHTFDIFGVDPSIPDQHLRHANDLVSPLFFVKVGAVGMGDSVGGHFMAIGIKILHVAIVCPLMRYVECCLYQVSLDAGTGGSRRAEPPPENKDLITLIGHPLGLTLFLNRASKNFWLRPLTASSKVKRTN